MNKLFQKYGCFVDCINRLNFLPPLLARITLGAVFIESGWGKIHNISKVTEFFTSLGIPAPHFQAQLVASTELICGTFLLLGFLTQIFSIPLIITMTVAIITAKREDLNVWTDLFGFSEFLYIILLIMLVVDGAGSISIDWTLNKTRKRIVEP